MKVSQTVEIHLDQHDLKDLVKEGFIWVEQNTGFVLSHKEGGVGIKIIYKCKQSQAIKAAIKRQRKRTNETKKEPVEE